MHELGVRPQCEMLAAVSTEPSRDAKVTREHVSVLISKSGVEIIVHSLCDGGVGGMFSLTLVPPYHSHTHS